MIVELDDNEQVARLVPCSEQLMPLLNDKDQPDHHHHAKHAKSCSASWHPEYARYMLEGVPAHPYGFEIRDLLQIECNMRERRQQVDRLLFDSAADNGRCRRRRVVTMASFPMLGTSSAFAKEHFIASNDNATSCSAFIPDEAIDRHVRFPTLTRNIRLRRGRKVDIRVPLFCDERTKESLLVGNNNKSLFEAEADLPASDYIAMDAMCFGMGCCCLQVTFQAPSLTEARRLYDQLAVLSPVMLALSAASPAFRGRISDVDCRWSVIAASVDDRTEAEEARIGKSRYGSCSRYIADDPRVQSLNDLSLEYDEPSLQALLAAGVDESLARHISHLFIRDPLVIYEHDLHSLSSEVVDDGSTAAGDTQQHFENIQSTNWQTVRFKPPSPTIGVFGWRVEFRPMEVQLTDTANAALCVFVILVTRMVATMDISLLMPISRVDENMQRAERRDAVRKERFWWRQDPFSLTGDVVELSVDEIVNSMLVPLVRNFIRGLHLEAKAARTVHQYVDFVARRASGQEQTNALWIREQFAQHPSYQRDSVVHPAMCHALVTKIMGISK